MSAAYVLRKGFGPFPAGTPASIIREHPNGSVGVIVNGNVFTVWKDDLAPVESAAILREPTKAETRIGWWFMCRFRSKTVALRTARNRVVAEAYAASERYDLPELRDALHAYGEAQE